MISPHTSTVASLWSHDRPLWGSQKQVTSHGHMMSHLMGLLELLLLTGRWHVIFHLMMDLPVPIRVIKQGLPVVDIPIKCSPEIIFKKTKEWLLKTGLFSEDSLIRSASILFFHHEVEIVFWSQAFKSSYVTFWIQMPPSCWWLSLLFFILGRFNIAFYQSDLIFVFLPSCFTTVVLVLLHGIIVLSIWYLENLFMEASYACLHA